LAQCGLQTAPKFEFSSLHQAVEFELSDLFRHLTIAACAGDRCRSAMLQIACEACFSPMALNSVSAPEACSAKICESTVRIGPLKRLFAHDHRYDGIQPIIQGK